MPPIVVRVLTSMVQFDGICRDKCDLSQHFSALLPSGHMSGSTLQRLQIFAIDQKLACTTATAVDSSILSTANVGKCRHEYCFVAGIVCNDIPELSVLHSLHLRSADTPDLASQRTLQPSAPFLQSNPSRYVANPQIHLKVTFTLLARVCTLFIHRPR